LEIIVEGNFQTKPEVKEIPYTIDNPDVMFSKVDNFDLINITNTYFAYSSGSPNLPRKTFEVRIPKEAVVKSISLEEARYVEFDNLTILPVPIQNLSGIFLDLSKKEIETIYKEKGYPGEIKPNPSIYESDNFFPKQILYYDIHFDGEENIVKVRLAPVIYWPKEKKIFLINKGTIKVEYVDKKYFKESVREMAVLQTDFASSEQDVIWNKTYGGSGYDVAYSVQQTSDEGYIMAGHTTSLGAGMTDIYVIKINANGDKEWERTFGEDERDWGYSVQQTSDGGYIVAGTTYKYKGVYVAAILIKIDSNGNKEWENVFNSGDTYARSVQQTSDGGYIMGGEKGPYLHLIKTYFSGNEQWRKTFEGSISWVDGYSVQQTSDGGYILGGTSYDYQHLIKTDANGNKEWENQFPGGEGRRCSAQQTRDGRYMITGTKWSGFGSLYDFQLIKTYANGTKQWEETSGEDSSTFGYSGHQTSDGGYIMAGGIGYSDVYLIKTDSDGKAEWNNTFGGSSDDVAYSVQQTSDGGYIIAGYTDSFGAGYSDVYLIKLKGDPCSNEIKDGDEIDVDCGGSCPPCVSCSNRIQDGDEEGLDCGGSCPESCHKLKILAVPLTWVTSQQEFEEAVDRQIGFFINATQLNSCRENVKVDKLDLKYKFDNFSCNRNTCGVSKIKPYVEGLGINTEEYDHIIGFAEFKPCPYYAGCSNGRDVAWVIKTYDSIAAHEIGHFYGLEDEYCSNQAGSTDSRCNDANESWWKGERIIHPTDINYLGIDLGCDSYIGDCCSNCSKGNNPFDPNSDYFACCEGNINSKGGRSIMSYANAKGPRDFDDRSKTHLDSFSRLQCIASSEAMALVAAENKIVDINLLVYNNDTVEKRWIWFADGISSVIPDEEGSYNLLIKDINNNTLFNHSFEIYFGYNGPVIKGENYSGIFLDTMELSLRVRYDTDMYKLELWHNQDIIFSEIFSFCNFDGICNGSETYLSCWRDCTSYSQDGLCLNYKGDGCDPDCARGVDSDCGVLFALLLNQGWNLISIPLDLEDDSVFADFDIYGYNGSWFVSNEIDYKLGYWVKIDESENLTLIGTEIENKTIELNGGWNLVGYRSLNSSLINETLKEVDYSVVYGYDRGWRSYVPFRELNSLEYFVPGYGYWVFVSEE
jgi:hypothetical protein